MSKRLIQIVVALALANVQCTNKTKSYSDLALRTKEEHKEQGFSRKGMAVTTSREFLRSLLNETDGAIVEEFIYKGHKSHRLIRIKQDSIYYKLGLTNLDRIIAIGDDQYHKMNSKQFISKILSRPSTAILFERSGKQFTLKIDLLD
ncbi:hypothetical protein [Pseudobacteriovorax antillogorgiicola]|uniref:Uncharacterized protein n=1 Tax=Pseudobacteriovorax antillogorgiicola TaxID=1513793 RepID=A0A1Y6BB71_9BACT|nr:hypothetical protein [Pseudobacteriovorax antillogorgiicola]TCS58749.1 hypothetical protein EDD56_102263 [Pseudobacteriovorax antillogorgiicola]SME95180.1 hypothetical protein SAMN06296036_102180 [Pseudobacteriovorax antillogorgiicola]